MKIIVLDDDESALFRYEKKLIRTFPDAMILTCNSDKNAGSFLRADGRTIPSGYAVRQENKFNADRNAAVTVGTYTASSEKNRNIFVRTFGNFDIFLNGRIVKFNRSKAKELLAYLVDRRGSGVSTPEAYSVLWEDSDYTSFSKDKIQHAKKDLRDTLKSYGLDDILITGWNQISLDTGKVSCDYYDYLEGRPQAANYYNGEYMSQYSWAENTLGILESRRQHLL